MIRCLSKWNCLVLLVSFLLLIVAVNGVLVSGREPKGGENTLELDNSQGPNDVLVVLMQKNWPTPLCAVLIPKGESTSFNKMQTGEYSLYYIIGKGWNSAKNKFVEELEVGMLSNPFSLEASGYTNNYRSAGGNTMTQNAPTEYISNFNNYVVTFYPVNNPHENELISIDRDDFPEIL